ncbi:MULTISPECIES: type III secretion system inner membrane ring lipoprotein SctJ [unclassified Brenneria]|uniref:type III secretion system inner membrane ring lipoprotein SctJ n=1 Tax=unclassified Brenneria TaxID=2634434 RepID=UPI001551A39E|nr:MULTISPECIES: type III secretion inner membrane ring lipoprotein SctJ [unclassified Brenneria]MBJ7220889.1 type III secretion inner membrane ring lipoprotein SctJ [Brenneria sp. L3-3C-1]MEE3642129.1 type III secretion inner membrane ring lipoprotein SctJ [Brenneria sp. L3_3C_1]MEE3650497.1 type III secretion inner membrane ring lipoprotein SctJ [Brenneria sp. HEZEL_4_2_4]NPD00453.1 type III secretion inner membrane ring lipoprotein SctJ [Brenneria sp. hezel4-2-4]
MKTQTRAIIVLLALLLTGCGKLIELNRGLSENDANEAIAMLGRYQIVAEKRADKTGVTLVIEAQDMERAVNILNAAGLPRQSRTNLGEVFQKSGVISTPLEERARYIYALSQEVEATLTQIDGVLVARVHVVLPERIAPGEPVQPASAAVFIKYRAELDPDGMEPRIRRMVSSSIPGLAGKSDKDLAIVFVPAEPYQDTIPVVTLGPFTLTPDEMVRWQWCAALLGALLIGLLGWRVGKPHLRQWRRKRADAQQHRAGAA